MRRNKYIDLYVIRGNITVPIAKENGKVVGETDLLLKGVMIKVPKVELFGYKPIIGKYEVSNLSKKKCSKS